MPPASRAAPRLVTLVGEDGLSLFHTTCRISSVVCVQPPRIDDHTAEGAAGEAFVDVCFAHRTWDARTPWGREEAVRTLREWFPRLVERGMVRCEGAEVSAS